MADTIITDTIKMPEFNRLTNPTGLEYIIALSNNVEVRLLLNDLITMFNLKAAAPIPVHITDEDANLQDGIYVPVEEGQYINLDTDLVYDPTEGLTFFIKSDGIWTKNVTPINFTPTGEVVEDNPDAVSGGEVFDSLDFLTDCEIFQKGNYSYNISTGILTFQTSIILITKNNTRIFIEGTTFNVIPESATNGQVNVIYIDVPNGVVTGNSYTTTLKTSAYNNMPSVEPKYTRILLGISENSTEKRFIAPKLDLYEGGTNNSRKRLIQILREQVNSMPTHIYDYVRDYFGGINVVVRGGLKSYSFSNSTGIYTNNLLLTLYDNMGRRKFLVNTEGAANFRITNFRVVPEGAAGNTVWIIYTDIDNVNNGNALISTSLYTSMPVIDTNKRRVVIGFAYKNNAGEISFRSDLLQVYEEIGSDVTRMQELFKSAASAKPLSGKKIVCFGDSVVEFGNYPEIIANVTGATVYNVGFGGCRMGGRTQTGNAALAYNEMAMYKLSETVATQDFTALENAAIYLRDTQGDDNTATVALLESIDFNTVDYITIGYGTNDFSGNLQIGTDNYSEDFLTVKGATNLSIKNILTAYPHLKVLFVTPTHRYMETALTNDSDFFENTQGNKLIEVCDAIIEVANANHIDTLDLYRTSGFNKYNHTMYFVDGVHPNESGYVHLGQKISAKLVSMYNY